VVNLADALSASLAAARDRGEKAGERRASGPARGARQHRPAAAARSAKKARRKKRA